MEITVNLNMHYSAPPEVWKKISRVYASMPYWAGDEQQARWLAKDIDVWASAEPGGLQFSGTMPDNIWKAWYDELKKKLTAALGYAIGEPEDGYDFICGN